MKAYKLEEIIELLRERRSLIYKVKALKNTLENTIEGIKYKYFIRPYHKIKNIIRWIPVIWRDEEWDVSFLLEIIKFKIQGTLDTVIKENYIHESEIEKLSNSINKVIEHINNYENPEKYEEELPFTLGHRFIPAENRCARMIAWNEDEDRELTEEEDNLHTKIILDNRKRQQEEWNAIWDEIKENGQGYGD